MINTDTIHVNSSMFSYFVIKYLHSRDVSQMLKAHNIFRTKLIDRIKINGLSEN